MPHNLVDRSHRIQVSAKDNLKNYRPLSGPTGVRFDPRLRNGWTRRDKGRFFLSGRRKKLAADEMGDAVDVGASWLPGSVVLYIYRIYYLGAEGNVDGIEYKIVSDG